MTPKAEQRSKDALIVGISNPATADRLVRLASVLAHARPMEITLTHVVTVASQISLTTGKSSPEVVRARDFLQGAKGRATSEGVSAQALVEVARSVEEGLLAAAESHEAAMILLGYSEADSPSEEEDREKERVDRTVQRIARKARKDLVAARFRGMAVRRVLVPVTRKPPSRVTELLCRGLVGAEGASVSFLHAVKPDASKEEAEVAVAEGLKERGLTSLGPLTVVEARDPVAAILEEANQADVIVVGRFGRPGLVDVFFSDAARKIADRTSASAFLVWSQEGSEA